MVSQKGFPLLTGALFFGFIDFVLKDRPMETPWIELIGFFSSHETHPFFVFKRRIDFPVVQGT